MKTKILFFPVGNGDMTLIKLADKTTILIDMNIVENNDFDSINELKKHLERDSNNRFFVNVLLLTHPDEDHIRGLKEYFHLGSLEDYNDDSKKIVINELWSSPMIFRRKSKKLSLSEDAKAFNTEASRRVNLYKENENLDIGDLITIVGEDQDNKTDDLENILVRTGERIIKINQQKNNYISAYILAPFPKGDDEEENKLVKNNSSIIINFSINSSDEKYQFLIGGDAKFAIWKKLWFAYEKNTTVLEYDLLLAPHHCSWHSISSESESENDNPKIDKDALEALSQAKQKAKIIASSKEIPNKKKTRKNDITTPPSYLAKLKYQKIVRKVDGEFLCLAEETQNKIILKIDIDSCLSSRSDESDSDIVIASPPKTPSRPWLPY